MSRLPATRDNTRHYSDSDVVDKYRSADDGRLTSRERRAVQTHFEDIDARVLDLGCGTGRTTEALTSMGFDVVGVDISEAMVHEASRYPSPATYLVGDATDLCFSTDSFRYALFSYNGIDELSPESDRYRALGELSRVLTPGGTLLFSTRNRRRRYVVNPPTRTQFVSWLRFWLRNARDGNLFSPYKLEESSTVSSLVYGTTPRAQKRQLERCGFELLDVFGRGGLASRHLGPSLYYAARNR